MSFFFKSSKSGKQTKKNIETNEREERRKAEEREQQQEQEQEQMAANPAARETGLLDAQSILMLGRREDVSSQLQLHRARQQEV